MVAPAGDFFPEKSHISIFFDMTISPKVCVFVNNSIFGVINYQNIDIFGHIFGPLTNDPFIKKIKIAAKAQPGLGILHNHGQHVVSMAITLGPAGSKFLSHLTGVHVRSPHV